MANNKTADDKTLQTYPSPDGKRWIELRQRPDGMFYFQEFYEAIEDIPGYGPQNYTSPGLHLASTKLSKLRKAISSK